MSDVLTLLIEFFTKYNIIFLAALIIIQGIGVPTGAGVLVLASGAFAYAGKFNIFLLFGEVWFFASFGDALGYWTWRQFGKFMLNTIPRMKTYLDPKLRKAEIFFGKHGKYAIIVTRFPLSALGALVNAAAGITEYKFLNFILPVMIGEFLWVAVYLGLGYWFGDAWETISDLITQFGLLLALVVVLIIVMAISYKVFINKKSKTL